MCMLGCMTQDIKLFLVTSLRPIMVIEFCDKNEWQYYYAAVELNR